MEETPKPFSVDRAKQGRAACKKCKAKCEKGELRLAKLVPSPYGEGQMKSWFHLDCLFEQFLKQRATTKRLENSDELEGWEVLSEEDQKLIIEKFNECEKLFAQKTNQDYKEKPFVVGGVAEKPSSSTGDSGDTNKHNQFREFRRLVANITNESSYLEKTACVSSLFKKDFQGDIVMWCRLLLPGVVKRIYNLQSKQLVKLFSRIFGADQAEMLEHLEQGDVGETIEHFFKTSTACKPAKKSQLGIKEVDDFLQQLSKLTREDDQSEHFRKFALKCTANDLKLVIRLIKHDLRMNAGAKHVLDGVHPDAYESYQSLRDLPKVIRNCLEGKAKKSIAVMTPVLPMLAEPCKSIAQAMKKCPNGIYSEIKYDGERVQLHKQGNDFRYFSRSLKPVLNHKIAHFKDYIPQAFPHGKDLILDSEILMIDVLTGKPLPFGTLGKHKKEGLQDASVCLFVFDCIYYNGEVLTDKPLKARKKILQENMVEIKNHIMFSEMEEIREPRELAEMISKALNQGLEGLVLKDLGGIYEPGKRHWLKVKKDYLFGGSVADSADLIVLGAWYGTGKKGGIMSVFLMGLYDGNKFLTVTKVHTGHDDETLERLQQELDMIKISSDPGRVPKWLKCTKSMIPDFVAKDPKAQPIWEITGAEFTRIHDVHTANGISIRFPRVTRIRPDKTYETATNLEELEQLFKTSKENFDGSLFNKELEELEAKCKNETSPGPSKIKPKTSPKQDVSPSTSPKKRKKSVEIKPTKKVKLENPLPEYFNNVNLQLEIIQGEDYEELLRLFVAFSGTIVSNGEASEVTHILHSNDSLSEEDVKESWPKEAMHVRPLWIKDCILQKQLLDVHSYLVELI